jgi:hypothetical protein
VVGLQYALRLEKIFKFLEKKNSRVEKKKSLFKPRSQKFAFVQWSTVARGARVQGSAVAPLAPPVT